MFSMHYPWVINMYSAVLYRQPQRLPPVIPISSYSCPCSIPSQEVRVISNDCHIVDGIQQKWWDATFSFSLDSYFHIAYSLSLLLECCEGSQTPHCELSYGDASGQQPMMNWWPPPIVCEGLIPSKNQVSKEEDTSWNLVLKWLQLQPTLWLQFCERPWARSIQPSWGPDPQNLWDNLHMLFSSTTFEITFYMIIKN